MFSPVREFRNSNTIKNGRPRRPRWTICSQSSSQRCSARKCVVAWVSPLPAEELYEFTESGHGHGCYGPSDTRLERKWRRHVWKPRRKNVDSGAKREWDASVAHRVCLANVTQSGADQWASSRRCELHDHPLFPCCHVAFLLSTIRGYETLQASHTGTVNTALSVHHRINTTFALPLLFLHHYVPDIYSFMPSTHGFFSLLLAPPA